MNRSIKQTTEEVGLSADTLRYYEKKGIITSKRHENGYRYYDERDIAILKSVAVMKYARFTLAEIKSMRELYDHEPTEECNETCKRILNAKIAELNQAIDSYQKIVTLMGELMPLMDDIETFLDNEQRIDAFVEQIFNEIKLRGTNR